MKNELSEREAPLRLCTYYMGVDPASVGIDSTVFTILEKWDDWSGIVKYIETQREDLMQTAGRIIYLNSIFHFQNLYIDQTGIGEMLVPYLKGRQLPVEGIRQTMQVKEDIYQNLKTQLENKLYLLYNDKCRKQLSDMLWEYTEEGKLKIYTQDSRRGDRPGGDDYSISVALAALALRKPKSPVLFSRVSGVFNN